MLSIFSNEHIEAKNKNQLTFYLRYLFLLLKQTMFNVVHIIRRYVIDMSGQQLYNILK
jgi:hypothetical protein